MIGALKTRLRRLRHAAPWLIERWVAGPDASATARRAARLARQGQAATVGLFSPHGMEREAIVEAYLRFAQLARAAGIDACLSIKAPKFDFDPAALRAIAATGLPLVFDAHGAELADATQQSAEAVGAGLVLPARWRRSLDDAARWKDRPVRIRVVKGEWPDPDPVADAPDRRAAYLALVRCLAGRTAPVGVATHDPELAREAIGLLQAAGTPPELELLRGLPNRRCLALARELQVPVRLYLPFGRGWWSYAIDSALARPYLPLWWLKDRVSSAS